MSKFTHYTGFEQNFALFENCLRSRKNNPENKNRVQ